LKRRVTIIEIPCYYVRSGLRSIRIIIADIESTATVVQFNGREILVKDVVFNLRAAVPTVKVIAVKVNAAIVRPRTTVVDERIAYLHVQCPNNDKVITRCEAGLDALKPAAIAILS